MAVAYRSHSTLSYGSRTNSTLTAPSGIQDNDVLLAVWTLGRNPSVPTITPPSGFVTVSPFPSTINKGAGYQSSFQVYYKIASSESGDYTFSHAAADSGGILYALSRSETGNPFSPTSTSATGDGGTATATGVTTTINSTWIGYFVMVWDVIGFGTTEPAGTTPTFTERFDQANSGNFFAADGVLGTAGATGNKTHQGTLANSAGNPNLAVLVAVADVVADAGGFPPFPAGVLGSPALMIWDQAGVF